MAAFESIRQRVCKVFFFVTFENLSTETTSGNDNPVAEVFPVTEVVPEHSKALEAPEIDPLNHSNQIYTNLSYFQTCAYFPSGGGGERGRKRRFLYCNITDVLPYLWNKFFPCFTKGFCAL